MGLDNWFNIKSRKNETVNFEIAYFRKFYELDSFIRSCAKRVDPEDDYAYEVSLENLKALREELLPTVKILIQIPERLLLKYDENYSYPKKYKLDSEDLAGDDFNPLYSTSYAPGYKAMRLYNAVCVMIDILEDDYYENHPEFGKGYYVEFRSSY